MTPSFPTVQIRIAIALAWCLAWGEQRESQLPLETLQQMRQALRGQAEMPPEAQTIASQVQALLEIEETNFPPTIDDLKRQYGELLEQQTPIGLVYGGATKIKQYVFEAAKLAEVRGASALLDRVNLVDLPAFFGCDADPDNDYYPQCQAAASGYCKAVVREGWLEARFPDLSAALIPELIVYSTGGNILAFCPAAFVDDLANAIERRYTEETLTANSCAVGDRFQLLEIRFGLLKDPIEDTFWRDRYQQHLTNPLIQAYFQPSGGEAGQAEDGQAFANRKNFNELAGRLANLFNQRRNGNPSPTPRPSRCYPPMFETHPYVRRDGCDGRSAIGQAQRLPGDPWVSESLARKRLIGQIAKRELNGTNFPRWWTGLGIQWDSVADGGNLRTDTTESWVKKFEQFLHQYPHRYYEKVRAERISSRQVSEAQSLREISNASTPDGFVAYIYADGNNMGGYIRQAIKTPQAYQQFSQDIFDATEKSVYTALAQHLQPHRLQNLNDPENQNREGQWVHPFEILTIGGDDVMLIVPANCALAIAKTIGEEFERRLLALADNRYRESRSYDPEQIHRYHQPASDSASVPSLGSNQCKLSMSSGVLIAAANTPIYYAERLATQLLKSAKTRAKALKQKGYCGGTVDFLVMKAVTMLSSSIGEFRSQGLTKAQPNRPTLKLYAAPYTLHELGGLLQTAEALKEAEFPRSQLYQIRSLLEQGKRTAMLNYRYFRVRLKADAQALLLQEFEEAWCDPKDPNNNGNLAPWMSLLPDSDNHETADDSGKAIYETLWRELVDLYPFIDVQTANEGTSDDAASDSSQTAANAATTQPALQEETAP